MEVKMRNKVTTGKVLLISFLSLLVMVSAQGLASLIFVIPIPEAVSSIIVVMLYVALAFLGVKILSEKVLHLSLYECRIDKPHIQMKWLICAFVLPITVIVIF